MENTEQVIEIEALARQYAPQRCRRGQDSARVAAGTAILDRAFSRPSHPSHGEPTKGLLLHLRLASYREEWEAKYCSKIESAVLGPLLRLLDVVEVVILINNNNNVEDNGNESALRRPAPIRLRPQSAPGKLPSVRWAMRLAAILALV